MMTFTYRVGGKDGSDAKRLKADRQANRNIWLKQ